MKPYVIHGLWTSQEPVFIRWPMCIREKLLIRKPFAGKPSKFNTFDKMRKIGKLCVCHDLGCTDLGFGSYCQQKDLYEQAVISILNEVLEGFNCTIFAFGQIGIRKTYTMEGECKRAK
ncbi:kinesin-like protein KIN-5C, partial [Tanacetum coccineum]